MEGTDPTYCAGALTYVKYTPPHLFFWYTSLAPNQANQWGSFGYEDNASEGEIIGLPKMCPPYFI